MKFRLSESEFFILNRLYHSPEIGMVMSPRIEKQFGKAMKDNKYPFRKDDGSTVVGVIVKEMPI